MPKRDRGFEELLREYTKSQTLAANLPYAAMLLLGAATIACAFGRSGGSWAGGLTYVAYGIAGALWIMVFVCPYCTYFDTRSCPCGYGLLAARLARKGSHECFAEKFRRHIPVIVPLWLIPVVCGGVALGRGFSWPMLLLVSAFAVNSYVILPLVSKRHGCKECPQKEGCPWMAQGAQDR
jgi:hypothetical protein